MLAQEPWCFHPEEMASLTDAQIENFYLQPAMERHERMEAEREGRLPIPPIPGVPDMPDIPNNANDTPPDLESPDLKEYVIKQYVKMGMSRDSAIKKYETELRDWQCNQG